MRRPSPKFHDGRDILWGVGSMSKRSVFSMTVAVLVIASGGFVTTRAAGTTCPTYDTPDGKKEVDVTQCTPAANGTDELDDTAALQAANDAIAAIPGGGYVKIPGPGTYRAANVQHDSNVEFYGTDRQTTIIESLAPQGSIFVSRRFNVDSDDSIRGSINAGSKTLAVPLADVPDIKIGSLVAIKGAGGMDPVQSTTLTLPILANSGSIVVDQAASTDGDHDWAEDVAESKYLVVENEVLQYASLNYNTKIFTVAQNGRGKWTTAAAHMAGKSIGQALRHVAKVEEQIGSNTFRLSKAAVTKVTLAPVMVGSQNMKIHDLTLDGAQLEGQDGGSNSRMLRYRLARDVHIFDCTIQNGDEVDVAFSDGTRESSVSGNHFVGIGEFNYPGQANVFLFGKAIDNLVTDNVMEGPVQFAVFNDDRSESSSEWDGPSDGTVVTGNAITPQANGLPTTGIRVDGSTKLAQASSVVVSQNSVSGATTGIAVGSYSQGLHPGQTQGTSITSNTMMNTQNPCADTNSTPGLNSWSGNTVTPQGGSCPQ